MTQPSLPSTQRFTLAGFDVALAARIAGSSRALAVYLDRRGQPTDRYREVEAHELRRTGAHLATIKAAIAALPELRFPWDVAGAAVDKGSPSVHQARPAAPPPGRGPLFAHNAIPPGDE